MEENIKKKRNPQAPLCMWGIESLVWGIESLGTESLNNDVHWGHKWGQNEGDFEYYLKRELFF